MIVSIAKPIASSIARSLTASGSASAAPALDIRAHVGTFASRTSTGTQDVTVPFESKAFFPFSSLLASAGASTGLNLGFGGLTASAQSAISVSSLNGLTTSNTDRRHDNADAVSIITDGTVTIEAARSAIAADKVTLNWTTASATAFLQNFFALSGADLEVSLTQHQMNGTNAAQPFAHGLSGAPTWLLFFGCYYDAAPPQTAAFLGLSIGAWAAGSQWSAAISADNAQTTTRTRRALYTNAVQSLLSTGVDRSMGVSSVDGTNVNVTYPIASFAYRSYFFMLAIRGAKCQVGTYNTASSNTIATPGLTPKLFLPVFIPNGVGSAGSVLNDLCLSIGASDGTNNVSCGISDANGVTTTNARRFQSSTTLQERNTLGTVQFEATAVFSGESIILTPTTTNTNFGQAGYMVIGS